MMATIMSKAAAKKAGKGKTIMSKVSDKTYSRAEGVLDKYSKGQLTATEVQKELKKFGYGATLRGKSNIIPVFPLSGGSGFDVEL
tara:strand:- start:260 stop:514 length:255 start_codon:yes stop_codon:yes gene_type:complete